MDYKKIYNQLIERAQNRTLEGYREKHHILPKCLGGGNEKSNLVKLTPKEHFICHRLLCKIYPKNKPLTQALWLMAIGKNSINYKHVLSSRAYQELKENFIATMKGNKNMFGKTHSKATKEKMRKSHTGRTLSKATKEKMSKSATGKIKSKSHKLKISLNHPLKKAIIQYNLDLEVIKEYPSIHEAARETGGSVVDISATCNGRQKTSRGFIWKFK